MAARRSSRGTGVIALSSNSKKNSHFERSENDFTDDDVNRMSGAFELDNMDKAPQTTKNKHTGSLFSAKVIETPRRRSAVGTSDKLLPMKKSKAVPVKISKKKTAPPPPPESEFDNMADMFGTSPIVKPTVTAATSKKQIDKSPIKAPVLKKQTEKTPLLTEPVISRAVQKRNESDIESQYEDLQRRFEQLNMLRTTEAERVLDNYRKAAETRDHAAQKLIESLQNENALLKERLEAHNRSRRDSGISVTSVSSVGTSLAANNIINLYQSLCGLEVKTISDNKWSCTLEGRHGAYSFELEYDIDEAEYTYTPVFTKESTVWERLPGYLKEEIVFDDGYIQAFFWRALNFLMTQ